MALIAALNKEGKPAQAPANNYYLALSTLTILFFMMGFITCMNDILIPYLKSVFSLNYTEAMLVNMCFFMAYFVVSVPSGLLVGKIGYKKGIIAGFILAALGCLLFYPSAELKSYPLFLFSFFVLASGITLLQVAGNPYVAVLGKAETASARLTLTQAFNSVGTTVAPVLGSILILTQLEQAPDSVTAVKMPYLVLSCVMLLIALVISFIRLPEIKSAAEVQPETDSKGAWSFRHLRLGAVGIFLYVGAEVAIGSFLVNYFGLSEVMGMAETEAGHYVAFYWGGAMVGRFIGAYVLRRISPEKVLVFTGIMAIILILLSLGTTGLLAMWSLLAVGLFNAVMFATIFTLAVKNLKEYTNQGSGILCTAIVGGALIPLLQGFAADAFGLRLAFLVPVVCYLYIAWYGAKGYKTTE